MLAQQTSSFLGISKKQFKHLFLFSKIAKSSQLITINCKFMLQRLSLVYL